MAGAIHIEGRVFHKGFLVHGLGVPEGHHLVPPAMDDESGRIHFADAVNVGEFIEGQRPPQVEGDSHDGGEARLDDQPAHLKPLCQEARGSRADGPAMHQDCEWVDPQALCEVQIDGFDIIVERLLIGYLPVTLPVPSVLEDDRVDADLFKQILLEVVLHPVDVLGIRMAEDNCVLGLIVHVPDLDLRARLRVQVEVVRVERETRHRRAEEHCGH